MSAITYIIEQIEEYFLILTKILQNVIILNMESN